MFTRIYIYGRIPLRIALQDTIHNAHKRAWQTSYEPIKSRYIPHSRMIAPRYHIRPSPTLHIPLVFTPGHHVKSLEGFHVIQETRKLDRTGSALLPSLEGWRCFIHHRCGSVGGVGGFPQPAPVRGGWTKHWKVGPCKPLESLEHLCHL